MNRRIPLFFLVFPLVIFSEETLIVDPLMQRPWILDSQAEEKNSYHRFLASSKEIIKTKLAQDAFGRNYHVYPSLKIRYTIDNDYHKEFPILEDGDLAIREMEALVGEGREKDALFLGKGIGLCQRLHAETQKDFMPLWAKEANILTSQLSSRLLDKPEEMFLASDPFGCYAGGPETLGNLFLESETFRYRLVIPSQLRYEGLFRTNAGHIRLEKNFMYRLVRFVEFLSPTRNNDWDDMEEALTLQTAGLTKKAPRKILFSVASTFDTVPRLRNSKDYFRFWDKMRGLNPKMIHEKSFTRFEENGDYISKWKVIDETGNVSYYQMKEYYFYKAPLGFLISLSYPESEKEKANSYWNLIRSEFKVREY